MAMAEAFAANALVPTPEQLRVEIFTREQLSLRVQEAREKHRLEIIKKFGDYPLKHKMHFFMMKFEAQQINKMFASIISAKTALILNMQKTQVSINEIFIDRLLHTNTDINEKHSLLTNKYAQLTMQLNYTIASEEVIANFDYNCNKDHVSLEKSLVMWSYHLAMCMIYALDTKFIDPMDNFANDAYLLRCSRREEFVKAAEKKLSPEVVPKIPIPLYLQLDDIYKPLSKCDINDNLLD